MAITVNLYAGMERIAGSNKIEVEIKDGSEITVEDLLLMLIKQYGDQMKAEMVDLRTGEFASSLIIHNGKSMQLIPNLGMKLQDQDEISLITFCSGG